MRWRRRRRLKKVRPGDGSELTKYRLWQSFSRSVFYIDLPPEETDKQLEGSGKGNVLDTYAVDVHFFAEDLRSAETIDNLQDSGRNVPDIADRASEETDRALELRTRDRQRKLVSKIDAALRRIENDEFGYCEMTGEPISLKRLDARPIATMTLEAQEKHERREKVHRDD